MDIKEMASTLGKKGGNATLKKLGKEHFSRMGKISGKVKRDRKQAQTAP